MELEYSYVIADDLEIYPHGDRFDAEVELEVAYTSYNCRGSSEDHKYIVLDKEEAGLLARILVSKYGKEILNATIL